MSQVITVREVNQNTSAVFRRIRAGEELIVTRAGQPEARIIPFQPRNRYEEMVADGRIIPAANNSASFTPLHSSVDIDQLLEDERADRPWL